MENNLNNNAPASVANTSTPINPNEQGRWVAVDANSVAVPSNVQANQPFQGSDGAMYCFSESPAQLAEISSNYNNAVPVPSSIVQMPPIVQPIALVPYTSQNQPLLQYDPYSRPLDPPVQPKAPEMIRKPYRGISLAAFLIALISAVVLAVFSVACFKATDVRTAFNSSGIDMVSALLAAFGLGTSSNYYADRIEKNADRIPSDLLSTIIVYAVPVFVTIVFIVLIVLAIKYLVKLAKKQSPRCFSVGALISLILCLSITAILLGMSNAEVGKDARAENVGNFFLFKSTIYSGIGLIIVTILSLALLILPLCAKKNKYYQANTDPNGRTYTID